MTVFLIFILFFDTLYSQSNKNFKKEDKLNQNLEKKIFLLEKKVKELEKKILLIEKKLSDQNKADDFEIKIISKELIENKNKGIVKIDAYIKNNTSKTTNLVFGKLYIIDPITREELYSDNFYYEKTLNPQQTEKVIIAVPSTHSSYELIKKRTDIIIKFTPKVVK